MPRVKLSERLPNPRAVSKLIEHYVKVESAISLDEMLARTRISRTRYYARLKDPGEYTLAEMRVLGKTLNIPKEELIAAFVEAIQY
mgnify:CR=1 FL=1